METEEPPAPTEVGFWRGRSCWCSLMLIVLMLLTVLVFGGLLLYGISHVRMDGASHGARATGCAWLWRRAPHGRAEGILAHD